MRLVTFVGLLATLASAAPEDPLPLANPGFEDGLVGWEVLDQGMSTLSSEQAASGRASLKVVDASEQLGSDAVATALPIEGGEGYVLRGKAYPLQGEGLGIYVRLLDENRKLIGRGDEFQRGAPSRPVGQWVPFEVPVFAPPNARYLQLWIHSYAKARVTAHLDDFAVIKPLPTPPPWTPQYKLRPDETARLTAADVVGPDGLVYPDFSYAGVPGGIPEVAVKVKAADCGAVADDGLDDAAALAAAVERAAELGGGAVLLGPGVFHLDHRLAIKHNNIVLRGAGRGQTRLIFRYAMGPEGLRWASPLGDELYGNSALTLQARPTGLERLAVLVGDTVVASKARKDNPHWGNTFSLGVAVSAVLKQVPQDARTVTLRGQATYADGTTRELARTLTIQRTGSDPEDYRRAPDDAAIAFCGDGRWWRSKYLNLAADGKRGDTTLTLQSVEGLQPGDWITIQGPATERWKKLTRNACQWGEYRRNQLRVERLDGNQITVNQPLRIEFPVIDGSRVWKIDPIRGCGIEDLSIEQTENLWMTTVLLATANGCWARGVEVIKCGRNPVYGYEAKNCTIADCVFDDAWFKGGGGTAYAGWEHSYDCLMTDTRTAKLRHAPLVQWAASGNVIRRSTFIDSDLQWHSGWTNENLFEQCTVVANTGNGAYGYGAWASPPEDTAHGPNGPRNVVYNCDLQSPRTGLWMGGMNEAWMILYNRFQVGSGVGIFAKTVSFDHVIRGNVIAVKDTNAPALQLATADCVGIEFYGNTIYGGGPLVWGKPLVEKDNTRLAYQDNPPAPTPPVPSIYEWQLARRGGATPR